MSTSLMRRNGYSALNPWRLFDEMERQMWDLANTPAGFTPVSRIVGGVQTYVPPVDVYETENDVLIAASVPGIDASNVNVHVQNGTVTISGEQRPVFTADENTKVRQHLAGIPQYGRFEFSFTLPCPVVSDEAQALYQDGILRLRFPKTPESKPVKIAVNTVGDGRAVPTSSPEQIGAGAKKSGK